MFLRTLMLIGTFFLLLPSGAFAQDVSSTEEYESKVLEALTSDSNSVTNAFDSLEGLESLPDEQYFQEVRSILLELGIKLFNSSEIYKNKPTDIDPDFANSVDIAYKASIKIQNGLVEAVQAIDDSDNSAYQIALDEVGAGLLDLDQAIKSVNSSLGLVDYFAWLFWGTLIFALISIVLFIISRTNSPLPSDIIRAQINFELFKSSLWPTAGFGVSLGTFIFSEPGGTFYFLWGPMLFGSLAFARGLYKYFFQLRPLLNEVKGKEKSSLTELIANKVSKDSDVYQKLQQKLDDSED